MKEDQIKKSMKELSGITNNIRIPQNIIPQNIIPQNIIPQNIIPKPALSEISFPSFDKSIFDNFKLEDLSHKFNIDLCESMIITDDISDSMAEVYRMEYEREERKLEALEATRKNTGDMNDRLTRIIDKQNDYIEVLKAQLVYQQRQWDELKNIFSSSEDKAKVEKNILKLIEEQAEGNNQLKNLMADKGGDILVTLVLSVLSAYLK